MTAPSDQPRLLSVNVGLPRDITWRGRTVHTGIWKDPVDGPQTVRRLNIDGDGQGDLAGHGGEQRAVFVYQIESHRYWEEQLGRRDFVPGQFGENFTVTGLADDEVCIGDRYRIGGAVFEVSQPRVTCYRVGIRMDEPRMPSLLVSHHRPGFYFRVLQEGEVRAGDVITKLGTGPEAMTVADVDALLYLPNHPHERLVQALRIPALSDGWRGSFQTLLDQPAGSGNQGLNALAGVQLAWTGFRPFRVRAIDRESTDVISIHLVPVEPTTYVPARPGQFLAIRVQPEAAGTPLVRSYSLSGPPDADADGYRISVKREPFGVASGYLHTALRPGDTLDVGAPRGTFVLEPGDEPVVLASAGVGATPVLAMLHALAHDRSSRRVWWLHGARNRAEHCFAAEADELLAALPNAHRVVCYSSPGPADRAGTDYDVRGHLTAEVMEASGVPMGSAFYVCGPTAFMRDLGTALASRGVAAAEIRTEIFGASDPLTPGVVGASLRSPHRPDGPAGSGPAVSFSRSNLTVSWDPAYASLLELAEACDVPIRWSCRTGVCHTCETGLVSGAVTYLPDPIEPPGPGNAFICCSQPQTEVVLDL